MDKIVFCKKCLTVLFEEEIADGLCAKCLEEYEDEQWEIK